MHYNPDMFQPIVGHPEGVHVNPFITYVLYKYWCTLSEDNPQRVETCQCFYCKNLF